VGMADSSLVQCADTVVLIAPFQFSSARSTHLPPPTARACIVRHSATSLLNAGGEYRVEYPFVQWPPGSHLSPSSANDRLEYLARRHFAHYADKLALQRGPAWQHSMTYFRRPPPRMLSLSRPSVHLARNQEISID
jgi:hypothetical protein